MTGYTDGTFRPDNAVTLEEAATAVLKLLGYKMTDLNGAFPQAQLNKAQEIGLRSQLSRAQGETMNYEDCAVLLYNALNANTAGGSVYGSTLGFTVANGQVDVSSVMLKSLQGPFVAGDNAQLPFTPVSIYRNDKVSSSAELNKYDVYYYSESLQAVWIYTRRAAGRITAVSPSASAPTAVTVARTSYQLGSTVDSDDSQTKIVSDLKDVLVPTTSEVLWSIVNGDILTTVWQKLTANTDSLLSLGLRQIGTLVGEPYASLFRYVGGGATYVCYVNGAQTSFTTKVKYPVFVGGLAVRQEVTGSVRSMVQLMPMKIDQVGAASVMSGGTRYEMADDAQVYLWYKGQYYHTKLTEVNTEGYSLTGWYDNFGCAAGKKVRVIVAVKND